MSFDIKWLASEVDVHGRVARILVAQTAGSVPREVGTSMIVSGDGQSGTIGGGALEFSAVENARELLELDPPPRPKIDRHPLGPNLGQCCGGAVTLITEIFDRESVDRIRESEEFPGFYARPIHEGNGEIPREIERFVKTFRDSGRKQPHSALMSGWALEAVSDPTHQLWIFGAGHVGRAVVSVLSPIPELDIHWIDTGDERYPEDIPASVTKLIAKNPAKLAPHAPLRSEHLVMTYSHSMDLEICSELLARRVARIGLIGSKTKWARFRSRLVERGHDERDVDAIRCPIGNPELGKHPQAIAIGVASDILNRIMPEPGPST
ncbi:MAG: xanthine dehydrogenase accessory protein XdhC [Albidovulum sp.]|nr:xanthine dehydrogenase accessory protein XdhC [Albidovulum sp.]MDE0305073.1 xanthine dehydrogenase accessory protein XdhC [Albidovulum sp.]MDE0533535.1 xanthine dehydrogenase accessory protein XdhC [Albidovulum sp.]